MNASALILELHTIDSFIMLISFECKLCVDVLKNMYVMISFYYSTKKKTFQMTSLILDIHCLTIDVFNNIQ